MIPTASPRRILKLAPSRTVFFPKDFFTPRSSMSTSASSSASSSAAPAERVGESAIAHGGRRGTRRDLEAAVPRVESSAPKRRLRLGSGDVPPPLVSFPSPKRGAAGAARPTAARAACIAPTTETHRSPRLSPGMTCACRRARGEWRAGDAPRGGGTKSDWIFAVHGRDELSFRMGAQSQTKVTIIERSTARGDRWMRSKVASLRIRRTIRPAGQQSVALLPAGPREAHRGAAQQGRVRVT